MCVISVDISHYNPIVIGKEGYMEPPTCHSNFLSSLKRVEKRLKSEQDHELTAPSSSKSPPKEIANSTAVAESASELSSPLYLLFNPNTNPNPDSAIEDSSEPPRAFLSPSSPQFLPSPHPNPILPSPNHDRSDCDDLDDDIGRLIRLLGLTELGVKDREKGERRDLCECRDGFHDKIVGVKGPKCKCEEERLNGWIEHFLNGNGSERIEPLRLAHLLLGRAVDTCSGSKGLLEFPSTVDEFLLQDPPR